MRGDGATLDRPKFTIDNAFAIGPVDVKLSPDGSKIATSSVDNSLRVYSLQDEESKTGVATGSYELLCEAPAQKAEAWKIDFSADGSELLTGQLSLNTLKVAQKGEEMELCPLGRSGDEGAASQKVMHSLAYSRNGDFAAAGNIDG